MRCVVEHMNLGARGALPSSFSSSMTDLQATPAPDAQVIYIQPSKEPLSGVIGFEVACVAMFLFPATIIGWAWLIAGGEAGFVFCVYFILTQFLWISILVIAVKYAPPCNRCVNRTAHRCEPYVGSLYGCSPSTVGQEDTEILMPSPSNDLNTQSF